MRGSAWTRFQSIDPLNRRWFCGAIVARTLCFGVNDPRRIFSAAGGHDGVDPPHPRPLSPETLARLGSPEFRRRGEPVSFLLCETSAPIGDAYAEPRSHFPQPFSVRKAGGAGSHGKLCRHQCLTGRGERSEGRVVCWCLSASEPQATLPAPRIQWTVPSIIFLPPKSSYPFSAMARKTEWAASYV